MIKVGITGGIASGKTTITNFLKKRGWAIHDSDAVVKKIYSLPTKSFIFFLKKIKLHHAISGKKISKTIIRNEIFNNKTTKKKIENFIHAEVRTAREKFLKKHKKKKTKIVILDIPLLFEARLIKICDYIILLTLPQKTKIQRALKRKGMNKEILLKILKHQISDSHKKKKSDFVVNTSKTKKESYKQIMLALKKIKLLNTKK